MLYCEKRYTVGVAFIKFRLLERKLEPAGRQREVLRRIALAIVKSFASRLVTRVTKTAVVTRIEVTLCTRTKGLGIRKRSEYEVLNSKFKNLVNQD